MKTKRLFFACLALLLIAAVSCKHEPSNDETPPSNAQTTTTAATPAIEQLSAAIAKAPANADLYAQRARLYYDNEGYDEAIKDLTHALQLDSTNVDYHHLLADVYLDYFQSRLALRTMERAAALYPKRIPTLLKLSEVQYTLKQYKASLQTVDRILAIDPQNAEGFLMMGLNLKEIPDLNRATKAFQKAIQYDPEIVDAWINLGQISAQLKRPDAAQYFDSALRIKPDDVNVIHAKADFLRDQNDLPGAIALYKKLNVIDPQYDEGYFNAGLLYMELDSVVQGREMFDLLIKIDPINIQAFAYRGIANERLGKTELARQDFETALRMAPDYTLAKEGLERIKAKK